MSLMQLPNELLLIILGHLDVPQLIEQRVHCRHLNNLIIKNADRLSKLDVSRLQLQGAWIGVDPTIRIELNTTNAICIGTKRTKLIKLPNYGVNNEQRPILTGWLRHCQIRAIIIRKLTEKSFTDEFVDWFVDEIDNRLQPSLIEFSNINCTQVSVHRIRRLFMAINSRLLQKLNIYDLKGVDKTADALLIESMNLCSLTSLKIESKTIDDNHDRCVLFDIDDAIMHQLIRYRHIIDLNLTQCSVSVDVLCDMIEVWQNDNSWQLGPIYFNSCPNINRQHFQTKCAIRDNSTIDNTFTIYETSDNVGAYKFRHNRFNDQFLTVHIIDIPS